ncbi:MAG: TonB-dependent receptor [Helicobacter sp.]|nr:TonB-dependent receptor [Helicobacter sp.]
MKKLFLSTATIALLAQSSFSAESYILDDSVISASGFTQDIKEAPATISVIKKEELESKPYRDVAEAIADIPGVDLFANKGKTGAYNITMRGITGYTLILVDGRRQGVSGNIGPNGFSEIAQAFLPPISAIERIEVIKGPMSTLYGSEALGGVVNIITKKVADSWGASVTTESIFNNNSEWGNTYGVSAVLSGPLIKDKLGLSLRVREFYREGSSVKFTTPDGTTLEATQAQSPTRANSHNIGAKLDYIINSNNSLAFDFDYGQNVYNNKNSQIGTLGLAGGYTDTMKVEKITSYISHSAKYDSFSLDSGLQYNSMSNDGRTVPGELHRNYGKNRDIKSEDFIADTKAVLPLGSKNILTTGAEYKLMKLNDNVVAQGDTSFSQYLLGIFAEDEIALMDNLNFTLGARYNKHEIFGSNISPRGYIVYNPSDNLTLKGGVATGFKAPSPNMLVGAEYNYSGQGRNPAYGNPNLKEETSINYELSALYNADSYYASITGFLTDFKDKISSQSYRRGEMIPGIGVCTPLGTGTSCSLAINLGKTRYMGAEVAAGFKVLDKLNFDLSYTYLDTEIKEDSTPANIGKPETDSLKHNVIGKVSYKVQKFTPYLKGQWQGDRYAGDERFDYYKNVFLLTLGGTYEFNKDWRLNAAVHNLLDKDFTNSFVGNPRDGYTSQYNRIEEGRRLWVSLTGNF